MTLEERLNALKEAFTGKTAEVEAKASEVTALTEKVASVEASLAEKTALVESMNAKVTELTEKLAQAESFKATAEAKIKDIQASAETAGKKAANIVASAGVQPVEVTPGEMTASAKSDEEITQEWVALKQTDAKAASDFYTKHRSAILRSAGLR